MPVLNIRSLSAASGQSLAAQTLVRSWAGASVSLGHSDTLDAWLTDASPPLYGRGLKVLVRRTPAAESSATALFNARFSVLLALQGSSASCPCQKS